MFSSWPVCAFVAGVKIGSGSRSRLAQARRAARDRRPCRSRGSPSSPSRRGSRARRTRSAASRAGGTRVERPSGRSASRWFGTMSARAREPERGEAGEHAALVGDLGRQHDVERRDAVAGDEQQPLVVERVELAHLAAPDVDGRFRHGRAPPSRIERVEALEDGVDMAACSAEVEDLVEVDARRRPRGRRGPARGSRAPPPRRASRCAARAGRRRRARSPASTSASSSALAEDQPVARLEVAPHPLRDRRRGPRRARRSGRACSRARGTRRG